MPAISLAPLALTGHVSSVCASRWEKSSVILPMVLQIGETIVLQRVELEEKAS